MTDRDDSNAGDAGPLVALVRAAIRDRSVQRSDEWQIDQLTRAQRTVLGSRVPRPFILGISGLAVVAAGVLLVMLPHGPRAPGPLPATRANQAPWSADRRSPDRLSYVVQSESPVVTKYRFSDGTSISTSDGDSVQILDTRSTRPRLRVTHGMSHVRVIHRPDTHWDFAAGPFDVDVVGTEFDLGWDQATSALTLRLKEGAVELRGPALRGALRVRAGQTALASGRTGRVSLTGDGTSVNATGAFVGAAPGPGNWRTMVARGHFDQVIKEAETRPLKRCVNVCSSEDLRALGDAARYSNRTEIAERAYRALRQRFSGTSDGVAAAFLLGRTYESKRQWDQASRWYSRYLTEAAEGEFAVEAAAGRARAADDAR